MANIRSVTVSYGKRTSPAQYQHEELRVEVGVDYDEGEAGIDQLTPLMLKASLAVQQVVHERLGVAPPRPAAALVVDTTEADTAGDSAAGDDKPAKRKRRTKAEMEAARAAEAGSLAELDAAPAQAVDLADPATTSAQIEAQAKADVRGGGNVLAELDAAAAAAPAAAPAGSDDDGLSALEAPKPVAKSTPIPAEALDPIAALEAAAAAPEPTMIIDNQQWTTMIADAIGKLGTDFSQRVLARMRELGHARMDAFTQEQRAEVLRWITDAEKAKK